MRILLVEDEEDLAKALKALLVQKSGHVDWARGLKEVHLDAFSPARKGPRQARTAGLERERASPVAPL